MVRSSSRRTTRSATRASGPSRTGITRPRAAARPPPRPPPAPIPTGETLLTYVGGFFFFGGITCNVVTAVRRNSVRIIIKYTVQGRYIGDRLQWKMEIIRCSLVSVGCLRRKISGKQGLLSICDFSLGRI